jgi:hypothetical protein
VTAAPQEDYSVAAVRARVTAAWQARTRAVGCTRCDRIVALACSARRGNGPCPCRCHVVPQRIQLRRTKGWRKPAGAVVVSRPSKWGNPHLASGFAGIGQDAGYEKVLAVTAFSVDLVGGRLKVSVDDVRRELRGKDLACWCPLPPAGARDVCHAAVLLEVANR